MWISHQMSVQIFTAPTAATFLGDGENWSDYTLLLFFSFSFLIWFCWAHFFRWEIVFVVDSFCNVLATAAWARQQAKIEQVFTVVLGVGLDSHPRHFGIPEFPTGFFRPHYPTRYNFHPESPPAFFSARRGFYLEKNPGSRLFSWVANPSLFGSWIWDCILASVAFLSSRISRFLGLILKIALDSKKRIVKL